MHTENSYPKIGEFEGSYKENVKTVGITQWVSELKTRNAVIEKLFKERADETASKIDVVVREARAELDKCYRAIIKRIEALD